MADQEIARLVVRLKGETGELKKELQGAKGQIQTFASDVKKALAAIGIAVGIKELLSQVKQLVQYGIDYNSQIEQQVLGIGSLISAVMTIEDAEGRRLDGMEKLNVATAKARDLYDQIRIKAMQTTATTPELAEAFQLMVAPAAEANMTLEQMLDLSVNIVQAMKAMGLPLIQSRMEMRGLLTGEENVRMDLMQRLQISGEIIKKMKEEGKLFDYLMERFSMFRLAGEKQLTTFEGMKTSLKDIFGILMADITMPIFEAVKEVMADLIKDLVVIDGKNIKLTEGAKAFGAQISGAFIGIIEHVRTFKDEYGAILTLIGMVAKGALQVLTAFFTGLNMIMAAAVTGVYYLAKAFDLLTAGQIPGLSDGVKQLEEKMTRSWQATEKQAEALNQMIFGMEAATKEAKKMEGVKFTPGGDKEEKETKEQKKAFEDLTKKLKEYEVALISLENPMEADRRALEDFIAEKMKDITATSKITQVTNELRDTFAKLQVATAIKGIADKTRDFGIELLKLKDPLAADEKELEVMVKKMTEAAPMTDELKAAVKRLEEAYRNLHATQRERAETQAKIEAQLKATTEATEIETTRIKIAYENRQVSAEQYYTSLRNLSTESTQAEIDAINKKLELATTEDERIKLRSEIQAKVSELTRKNMELNQEETNAIKERMREEVSLRELQINQRLAEIEAKRKLATESETNLLRQEIDIQRERLAIYEQLSLSFDKLKDPAGYIQVQNQILGIRDRLNDLNFALTEQTGTFLEGAKLGWNEYTRDLTTAFEGGREIVKEIGSAMQSSLKEVFVDVVKGDFDNIKNAFQKLADSMLNMWMDLAAKMAMQWIFKLLMGGAGGAAAAGGGAMGFQTGGEIPGTTGKAVPIVAHAKEFVQPETTVDYYGAGVMEAMRRKLIPKELFEGLSVGKAATPRMAYQAGGLVTQSRMLPAEQRQPINIMNLTDYPTEVDRYMASLRGENSVLNVISSRADAIKRILR